MKDLQFPLLEVSVAYYNERYLKKILEAFYKPLLYSYISNGNSSMEFVKNNSRISHYWHVLIQPKHSTITALAILADDVNMDILFRVIHEEQFGEYQKDFAPNLPFKQWKYSHTMKTLRDLGIFSVETEFYSVSDESLSDDGDVPF